MIWGLAAAVVIVGAFALSSSPAVAKNAFLGWQHWDFYTRPQKPVSVRYVWNAHYGGLHFPKKVTAVLTIKAPSRPQYWRATVLERFDGTRWLEHVWDETPTERRALNPAGAQSPRNLVQQEVTVRALEGFDHSIVGPRDGANAVRQPLDRLMVTR